MFQLVVSFGVVILAALIVCMILSMVLKKDFSRMEHASIARKAKKTARAVSAMAGSDESEA